MLSEVIDVFYKIENLLLENFFEIKIVIVCIGVADIFIDFMLMDIVDMYFILEKDWDKWIMVEMKEGFIDEIKELFEEWLIGVNFVFI